MPHTTVVRTWKYPELTVIARFDDPETGQELVTIETADGETWTRPSKVMMIYMMGYGGAFPLLRLVGWSELVSHRRLVTRREGRDFT